MPDWTILVAGTSILETVAFRTLCFIYCAAPKAHHNRKDLAKTSVDEGDTK